MAKIKHGLVGIHSRRPKKTVPQKLRKGKSRQIKQAFYLGQSDRIQKAREAIYTASETSKSTSAKSASSTATKSTASKSRSKTKASDKSES